MHRLSKIQSVNKMNERELQLGYSGDPKKSWHQVYANSAWIYIGGLPYELTEGDVLAVFSQYGEIVNINLVRDRDTGKSKGFCFICYADQRSTILATDNLNGITLCKRILQVDHVADYKVPKYRENVPEEVRDVWEQGCAPQPINIPQEQLKQEAKREKERHEAKLEQLEEVVPLDDAAVSKELKRKRKELKRERKEAKRQLKLEKKQRERTPDEERGKADDEGRWDAKKKKLDQGDQLDDKRFYGSSDHFNFGRKHKTPPPAPTHNIRPDFDKADWRDIELFKIVREHERREKGEKPNNFKEETHYVPSRLAKK